MAKKKQDLTPEERLAAALVPEEKWPYALPEGWKWVRLGDTCQFIGGGTPSKNQSEYWNGDIPWASIKDIKGDYLSKTIDTITELGVKNSATNICPRGSLIVATRIEPGKAIIANMDTAINQDLKYIQTDIDVKFLQRYFQASQPYFISKSSGSTVLGIKIKVLQDSPLPLPPLSEQHRLVARIESLFAKLDAAREKVQSVLDSHETRKAALLHEAFTGKLIGTDEREMKPLSEIVELVRIGPFGSALHKEDYIHDGIPVINPKHIANQAINPDKHISISTSKADSMDVYKMRTNDIIIGRRGEMGRTAPVSEKESGWLCGTGCMLLRLKKEYDARFYSQILASQQGKQYLEAHAVGSTMKNLNEKIIKSLPVPIFSPPEQQEIVRILDRLLAREQRARQAAEETLTAIDRMKQSILARAFRGEL